MLPKCCSTISHLTHDNFSLKEPSFKMLTSVDCQLGMEVGLAAISHFFLKNSMNTCSLYTAVERPAISQTVTITWKLFIATCENLHLFLLRQVTEFLCVQ